MPQSTRLILLLDSSGSMASQKSDIIGGVNETIRNQRELKPQENDRVLFNVVTFSGVVSQPTNDTLATVRFLTDRDYTPSGSTALFDAMGTTMQRYKNERDVIMLVATDGQENSSSTYNYKQVTEMVNHLRQYHNWNFIYLSEDIDTFKQGESLGISDRLMNCNNVMVQKNKLGSTLSSYACQKAITDMRSGQQNVKMSKSPQSSSPSSSFSKYNQHLYKF